MRGHFLETSAACLPVKIIRPGGAPPLDHSALDVTKQPDDALTVFERKRTEKSRVYEAKDRGVAADGERERQNGCDGETRGLPEEAERVAEISDHGLRQWGRPPACGGLPGRQVGARRGLGCRRRARACPQGTRITFIRAPSKLSI